MLPNAENVSYNALLSIDLSRDLMKTLPVPDLRRLGSRWHHLNDAQLGLEVWPTTSFHNVQRLFNIFKTYLKYVSADTIGVTKL